MSSAFSQFGMARVGTAMGNYWPQSERIFARNVDWNLFKQFYEIVGSGGISAAARALNKQQPSLSAALKRLEAHLGIELCVRTSHGIELNAAGREVFALCETMFDLTRRMPHEAAKAAGIVEGVIGLRTISNLVCPHLDAAIATFHATHPRVEIRLDAAPWQTVVESLKQGESEIGVACDSAPSAGLRYEPMMKETQQLYCSRRHALFATGPHDPGDLAEQPFVSTGQDEPEELARFRRRYGLGRRIAGSAENLQEVCWLIGLGLGIGFLPTVVAEAATNAADLWPLLPEDLLPSYHVYLITRQTPEPSTPTVLLLEAIRHQLRHAPGARP